MNSRLSSRDANVSIFKNNSLYSQTEEESHMNILIAGRAFDNFKTH
jgi:hypothetical protein